MKGQIATEFLVLVGIILLIFTAFCVWDLSFRQRFTSLRSDEEVRKLCEKVAFEINAAVEAGSGYKRKFYVEKDLFGVSEFDISVDSYSVFIDWGGKSTSCAVTTNITASIKKGWNLIENTNGVVYVI